METNLTTRAYARDPRTSGGPNGASGRTMKAKLVSLPFHWAYPSAPAKYLGCRVSIPAYDPNAPERSAATVRAARVASFDAAVGAAGGRRPRGPKLPRAVLVPTAALRMTWKDVGGGRRLDRIALDDLGFRLFKVEDLARTPFARCPSEAVKKRTLRMLERTCG